MNRRIIVQWVFSLVSLCQLTEGFTQVPVDLSKFDKKSAVQVELQEKALTLTWPAGNSERATVSIDLEKGKPLFQSIRINQGKEAKGIASQIDPAFLLTIGKRDLVSQNGLFAQ